jgi:hypothetical protein
MQSSTERLSQAEELVLLRHPIDVGVRVTTKRGEVSCDENDNQVRCEPGTRGVIIGVDRRDSGYIYSVCFGEQGPWVFLNEQEIADETQYEVERVAYFALTFNVNGRRLCVAGLFVSRHAAQQMLPKKSTRPRSEHSKVFAVTGCVDHQLQEWLERLKQPPEVIRSVQDLVHARIGQVIRQLIPTQAVSLEDEGHAQLNLTKEQILKMMPPRT